MKPEQIITVAGSARDSVIRRLSEKTRRAENGCLEWVASAQANGGYGVLCVGRAGQVRAHRAAWIIERGSIPKGLYVCHKCDNPLCCDVTHLFLGTPAENMADKEAKGRGTAPPVRYGEHHHKTKLTSDQVAQIAKSGRTLNQLAREYGVSSKTIWRIKKGKTWVHRPSTKRGSP